MTVEAVDALRHAKHLAGEHEKAGLYELADRIGDVDISDEDFKKELVDIATRYGLLFDLPEDCAGGNMKGVLATMSSMIVYGFLAGALWKTQQREQEDEDG